MIATREGATPCLQRFGRSVSLLVISAFAVLAHVESHALGFVVRTQSDDGLDDVEQNEGGHPRESGGENCGDELVDELRAAPGEPDGESSLGEG